MAHPAAADAASEVINGPLDIHKLVEIDRKEYASNVADVRRFRLYARGKQDSTLTLDQKEMLKGVLGNLYCDNICSQIVAEHADRLELTGYTIADKAAQEWLDTFWHTAKMDSLQARTHRRMVRDGNYCLMPVWDEEKEAVTVSVEPWWDGTRGVFIGYDAQGHMLYAVKEWDTIEGTRRTVYTDGVIQRFMDTSRSGAWTEYLLPGETPGGIPYTRDGTTDGEPMHIPFIHFVHEGDQWENYGSSILDGGVIGSQDQINDLQYDMSSAGRMTGYQMVWSKGYKLKRDSKNRVVQPRVGPGVWAHAEEPTAEYGVLPAGDLQPLILLYENKIKSVCRMTRTPFHVITGDWPSGEALYRAELPLVNKSRNQIKRIKPGWIELAHRAMEIANVYGKAGLNEDVLLDATFEDPARVDPLKITMADQAFWQAAAFAVQAGLPLKTFLRMQEWTEEQLTQYEEDAQEMVDKAIEDMKANQEAIQEVSVGQEGTQPTAQPASKLKPKSGPKPNANA